MRRDGTTGWALWQHSVMRDDEDEPRAYIVHVLDISKRKHAERRLDHQAHHDLRHVCLLGPVAEGSGARRAGKVNPSVPSQALPCAWRAGK